MCILQNIALPESFNLTGERFYYFRSTTLEKYWIEEGEGCLALMIKKSVNTPLGTQAVEREVPSRLALTDIFMRYHDNAGHCGRDATIAGIQQQYTWKGMWKDVETHLITCDSCARKTATTTIAPLQPIILLEEEKEEFLI